MSASPPPPSPSRRRTSWTALWRWHAFGAEAKFHLPSEGVCARWRSTTPWWRGCSLESMIETGPGAGRPPARLQPQHPGQRRIGRYVSSTQLLNSRGGSVGEHKTVFSASLSGNLIEGTDVLDVCESDAACRASLDLDGLVGRVIEQFEQSRRTASGLPTGELPVIFVPKAVAETLLSPLVVAFNGKTVQQGASPLKGRLGEKVFDERISVYDDGTVDFARAAGATDDEGVHLAAHAADRRWRGAQLLLRSADRRSWSAPAAPATASVRWRACPGRRPPTR